MPNFKKKPLVISAEQWWPGKMIDGVVSDYSKCNHGTERERELPHVHTLEGPLLVSPGDWIITGVKGEKYPCKDDVFRATYDEVPPSWLPRLLWVRRDGPRRAVSGGDLGYGATGPEVVNVEGMHQSQRDRDDLRQTRKNKPTARARRRRQRR